MRKETRQYFRQGKFFEELELYEEIIENHPYTLRKNSTLTSWISILIILGQKVGNALANTLCDNTTLTTSISKCSLQNVTLTSLNLWHNNLGVEGGIAITNALCKNTALASLDITDNNLGSIEGEALAHALCNNTTLTSLSLWDNNIGSKGIEALENTLCKNITLISLNLSGNELELVEDKVLANALCKNTTLTSLTINYNNIESEGVKNNSCENTALDYFESCWE
ncbi:hypothetical protein C2G38_2208095 [Gigaspora rosea]|uniref:Uncharacterized protein n=1 Tax=Gigaspora rosea TaxID=44941 RepID=A0A397UKD7_9GLOM|nr:hypothetical protein C2G38_2208095 [Gigaspora rosea]